MRRWQTSTSMATFSVTPTTSTIMPTTKAPWSYLRPYSIAALRRINLKTALISQVRMLTLFEVLMALNVYCWPGDLGTQLTAVSLRVQNMAG